MPSLRKIERQLTQRALRNNDNFSDNSARTNISSQSFFPHTTRLWNSLSRNLRVITDSARFKRQICPQPPVNPLYSYGKRDINKIWGKIRMECRALKDQQVIDRKVETNVGSNFERMKCRGSGLVGSVIRTKEVPSVSPIMAYSSCVASSYHPQMSLPLRELHTHTHTHTHAQGNVLIYFTPSVTHSSSDLPPVRDYCSSRAS